MATLLRSCAGCSAHILTNDGRSEYAWCKKCRARHVKPFDEWATEIKVGDCIYVQPYAAWHGLSHSRYLVVGREGDQLTVQVLGIPESRTTVHINHTGQHDLTPRRSV
jgi:hypothetical protein